MASLRDYFSHVVANSFAFLPPRERINSSLPEKGRGLEPRTPKDSCIQLALGCKMTMRMLQPICSKEGIWQQP